MTLSQYVYHASIVRGLRKLNPKKSTHGKVWVYATKHLEVAAAFLARWSDFDLALGRSASGKVYLAERYKNALESVYRNSNGSVYVLSSKGFIEGMTQWEEEVVNPNEVQIQKEIEITDTWQYLQKLKTEGSLELYLYPERPADVPLDDSDLLEKVILWTHQMGSGDMKSRFLFLHPGLGARLEEMFKTVNIDELKRKHKLGTGEYDGS